MRKLNAIGLALGAVLAMCVFMAPSAFAVSKILANGAEPSAVNVSISGALVLIDKNPIVGNIEVLCEGIFDGTLTNGVEGTVKEVLRANGTLVEFASAKDLETTRAGDDIECTPIGSKICANPTLVVAVNLPWPVDVELAGTTYFLDFLERTPAAPGYWIECKTGIGTTTVFCDGLVRAELLLDASGDLNAEFNKATSGTTVCSDGTNGTVESQPLVTGGPSEEPIIAANGALLTMSEV